MHIIFITQNYPPSVCGIGDQTYYLAKSLIKLGYSISVICSEKHMQSVEMAAKEGINVYPTVPNWDKTGYQIVLDNLAMLKPDMVFLQYEPYSFSSKGLPFSIVPFVQQLKKQGYKTLIFFHEIAVQWSFSLKLIPISIIQRCIAHLILWYANQGATSMAFYKKMFLPSLQHKVALQPIGSNVYIDNATEIHSEDIDIIERNSVPLHKEGTFYITCFGGDGPEKGYAILVEAIKNLPFAHLLFIGKGTNVRQYALDNDVTNRVHVTGIVSTEEVNQYLKMGSIFALVHADIRGGIGFKSTSLAAGFNAGLPVLGYKGAITETDALIHGENCWLVDDPTPKAFENAIKYLHSNTNIVKKLSNGSQLFYKTHLHWDVLAQQYDAILRNEKNIIERSTPSVLEQIIG
jgi:glycosyltransferase involved in cell wall biosynthesis